MSDTKTPDDREQTDWRCPHCNIDVRIVAPVGWFGALWCFICRLGMERTGGKEAGDGS